MLPSLPFDRMNEADVREEVLAPLIRRLGYVSGTRNDVIREQCLRYPKVSLGRKDPRKDPELRGKADYILEVDGRLRWTIEAKAPAVKIGPDDVGQAWTYANHPEVRAHYFVLCNGCFFTIYRTNHGPEAPAVLSLAYEKLDGNFQVLDNILGPEALRRDFANTDIDIGVPLAPGLRSVARITNGVVRYETNSLNLPLLNDLQVAIHGDAIERDENGHLVAFITSVGPSRSIQELNERLGFASFEMISKDSQLSADSSKLTTFVYKNRLTLPAGETILDFNTGRRFELPSNLTCELSATAVGTYRERVFSGVFSTDMLYVERRLPVRLSGSFEMHLA